MIIESIKWIGDIPDGKVELIDQTQLPEEYVTLSRDNYLDIANDIKRLAVRGAPAIAIAGAFGVVLGIQKSKANNYREFESEFKNAADVVVSTRPTAVNLSWAIGRLINKFNENKNESIPEIKELLLKEALDILEEDQTLCAQIGEYGREIIKDGSTILTHCNTGALATGGAGTAISILYRAHIDGKRIKVFADETRPLLQGARLTAWELMQYGIDVTLICDSAAACVMKSREVDCVITGADRIAANGDSANKIGTYGLSILAKEHNIPFYIAAPFSTFDSACKHGDSIEIETRDDSEVAEFNEKRCAPPGVKVYNPAFDVTPEKNITAFITDKGVIYPPFEKNINERLFENG